MKLGFLRQSLSQVSHGTRVFHLKTDLHATAPLSHCRPTKMPVGRLELSNRIFPQGHHAMASYMRVLLSGNEFTWRD
jgi:hypothetical protein